MLSVLLVWRWLEVFVMGWLREFGMVVSCGQVRLHSCTGLDNSITFLLPFFNWGASVLRCTENYWGEFFKGNQKGFQTYVRCYILARLFVCGHECTLPIYIYIYISVPFSEAATVTCWVMSAQATERVQNTDMPSHPIFFSFTILLGSVSLGASKALD